MSGQIAILLGEPPWGPYPALTCHAQAWLNMRVLHRCMKSMIGESMDLPTQALALGYLSLSWGFGTILGTLCQQHTLLSCCTCQHTNPPLQPLPKSACLPTNCNTAWAVNTRLALVLHDRITAMCRLCSSLAVVDTAAQQHTIVYSAHGLCPQSLEGNRKGIHGGVWFISSSAEISIQVAGHHSCAWAEHVTQGVQ